MKVNYGPCVVCGKPILFLGCKYCGPKCHFSVLEPADPEPEEVPPESQERTTEPETEAAPPAKRRIYL